MLLYKLKCVQNTYGFCFIIYQFCILALSKPYLDFLDTRVRVGEGVEEAELSRLVRFPLEPLVPVLPLGILTPKNNMKVYNLFGAVSGSRKEHDKIGGMVERRGSLYLPFNIRMHPLIQLGLTLF